jgi:hypothetical protein
VERQRENGLDIINEGIHAGRAQGIVILDDATGRIYYAQLVEEKSTHTVMTALRGVAELSAIIDSAAYSTLQARR